MVYIFQKVAIFSLRTVCPCFTCEPKWYCVHPAGAITDESPLHTKQIEEILYFLKISGQSRIHHSIY